MLNQHWKISLVALAVMACGLASGAAQADRDSRANFHGGGGRAFTNRTVNSSVSGSFATRSFSGGTNRSFVVNDRGRNFSGRRFDRGRGWGGDWDRGGWGFGLNIGIPTGYYGYDGYPAYGYPAYSYPVPVAPNCWNSYYGFNGYWYDGYCQQYPPPY